MKLYFVYNNNNTYENVISSGSGGSEFQFYVLAKTLSEKNNFNITIFNSSEPHFSNNIEYRNINDIYNNVNIDVESKYRIIVMRNFQIDKLLQIYDNNNIIIWLHDMYDDNIYESKCEILENIKRRDIKIVCVSKFHKNHIKEIFKQHLNCAYIYNSLYEKYYFIDKNIERDYYTLLYASSPGKGLDVVVNLFRYLYKYDKRFSLVIIKPDYSRDFIFKIPGVSYLGTIKCKKTYSILIQKSLCVIAPSNPETFGCVFAEAYHLGIPVLYNKNKYSGLNEIIDNKYNQKVGKFIQLK